ncbi:MAG: hypothetical protein KDA91_17535 [Planctomycetaceae bacterium]|nr:hypothetical protein [Planctomycetaceae bacterium]
MEDLQSRLSLALLMVLSFAGCNLTGTRQQTRYVDPVLPASMSCQELIDHLNRQTHGLHAWRSTDATVTARLPNGLPLRLSANIACAAPDKFRLRASNFAADVDLGTNEERVWFYSKPGEGQVVTWKHEDACLLQQLSVGIPRIDPDWLMVVLGVMPLDSGDFDVAPGPAGAQELWLTSVTDDANGQSLRRVIKVSTITGRVREHTIYDHERSPLVRATVRNHKAVNQYLLPQAVKLEFPEMDTELTIQLSRVETNCVLAESLWHVPQHRNTPVVDLGAHIRSQVAQHRPATHQAAGNVVITDSDRDSRGWPSTQTASLPSPPSLNSALSENLDYSQRYLRGISPPGEVGKASFNTSEESEWSLPSDRIQLTGRSSHVDPAVAAETVPDTPEFDLPPAEEPEWDLPSRSEARAPARRWNMRWFR